MKCYKCGKEGTLRYGLCNNCYKEILHNKYRKRKRNSPRISYIIKHLDKNEKILTKAEPSRLIYFFIICLFGISFILFPKTILEFFINNNKIYFLLLVFNILLFFFAVYLTFYFSSRDIYLTDKKIIGKWGLFKIKKINLPLNNLISIDACPYTGLEIDNKDNGYFFDFVGNSENFKLATILQIKKLIDSTNDENVLMSFSHSIKDDTENKKINQNMIICECCKEPISKDSITCIHCGQPVLQNERSTDLFIKTLCFLLPPVGILLFLLNIGPFPKFAKECLLSSVFALFIVLVIYLSLLSIL